MNRQKFSVERDSHIVVHLEFIESFDHISPQEQRIWSIKPSIIQNKQTMYASTPYAARTT